MCRWLEEAGADYLHISAGGGFPHPRNPAGEFPAAQVVKTYDTILSSGKYTFRNYLTFRTPPLAKVFGWWWTRPHRNGEVEGINLADARAVKQVVSIPVVVTGGFQTASVIARAIERGDCDGVTIARPLVANPDLVRYFEQGLDRAPRPCTYCNKCLFSFIEHPLACYEPAPLRLPRGDDGRGVCGSTTRPPSVPHRAAERRRLPAAALPQPGEQEPHLPVEHRRAPGRLRRRRHPDADQLGAEVRPRRRRRHRLFLDRGRRAREDRPRLRRHRERRARSLLARARGARARARLPLHRPARARGAAARRADGRLRQGPLLHEQARPAARLRGRARDARRHRGDQALVRRRRAAGARGRAGRRRDPRRQRLHLHAVPLIGDQRPRGRVRRLAREPRPLPAGDGRRDPRARSATTSTSRSRSRPPSTRTPSCPGSARATRSRTPSRSATGSRRRAPTRSTSRRAAPSPTPRTRRASSPSRTWCAHTT